MLPKLTLIAIVIILLKFSTSYDVRRYDRLPNNTIPISYNLHIVTNVHEGGENFSGTVQIRILVLEESDRIVLHGYKFTNVKLNLIDLDKEEEIDNLKYEFNSNTEQMIITAEPEALKLLAGNRFLITISYNARPCAHLRGFCLFYYEDENENETIVPIGATHLSRGNARMVFPCYDEPALKANFTISVTHGMNYTALSNMPRVGEPIFVEDGYVTTKFMESPPMSTYIVAITVSNYENITTTVGNTKLRLFFKPNSKGGRLALEVAKEALSLMNEYFNISFPLPKIDHFSVPGMASRGMENWGLITYPEYVLLNDLKNPIHNPMNFKTITHEMTHMWFGNLVTPAWWSDIWLSEGISTYYGYKFIKMIKPDFNISVDHRYLWIGDEICSLSCNAKSELEFDSIFGPIPYLKGHFFVSMFEKLLTEEVFRRGMVKYLQNHQYSVAFEDDLFDCLADSVVESSNPYFKDKISLIKAMKSWTTQRNHPLVIITRNYENGTFTLKQEPYKTLKEGNNELWWIPITFTTSKYLDFDNVTTDFMFPDVKQIQINPTEFGKSLELDDFLILNKNMEGLYRVTYDDKNWNLITCALLKDPTSIPKQTKFQMMNDIFEVFVKGYTTVPVLFNFLSFLKNETDNMLWNTASNILKDIFENLKFIENQSNENLKEFVEDIILNASQNFEADENSENFELTSENEFLFDLSCHIGLEKCSRIIDIILDKRNSSFNLTISEEYILRYGFCYAYKNSTKDYQNFINNYIDLESFAMINDYFSCTKNRDELKNLLEKELNQTTDMKSKDQIVYYALSNPDSLEYFIELFDEGDLELEHFFLHNVESAIFGAKTSQHKDMLIQLWKKMGHSPEEGRYYKINITIEKNEEIREKLLQWLKQNQNVSNLNCL